MFKVLKWIMQPILNIYVPRDFQFYKNFSIQWVLTLVIAFWKFIVHQCNSLQLNGDSTGIIHFLTHMQHICNYTHNNMLAWHFIHLQKWILSFFIVNWLQLITHELSVNLAINLQLWDNFKLCILQLLSNYCPTRNIILQLRF